MVVFKITKCSPIGKTLPLQLRGHGSSHQGENGERLLIILLKEEKKTK